MIVRLNEEAGLRLMEAVDRDGLEPDAIASQAVAVWSQLTPGERKRVGFMGLQIVVQRLREGVES